MNDPQKPTGSGDRDPTSGRFAPGNSANPGGRPKLPDFLRGSADELVQLQLTAALKGTMPQGATEEGEPDTVIKVAPNVRAEITQHLVDRIYGKAHQSVAVTGEQIPAAVAALIELAKKP